MDSEGRIKDYHHFRECAFYHGVEPGARRIVWKFLLGYYPPESTAAERDELSAARRYGAVYAYVLIEQ